MDDPERQMGTPHEFRLSFAAYLVHNCVVLAAVFAVVLPAAIWATHSRFPTPFTHDWRNAPAIAAGLFIPLWPWMLANVLVGWRWRRVRVDDRGFRAFGRLYWRRRLAWDQVAAVAMQTRWGFLHFLRVVPKNSVVRRLYVPRHLADWGGFVEAVRQNAPDENPLRLFVEESQRARSTASRAPRIPNWATDAVLCLLATYAAICFALGSVRYFDLVVPRSEWREDNPDVVTTEEALEDWGIVERVIRRGYAGYDEFEARGMDWSELFRSGEAAIRQAPEEIPIETLYALFVNALSPVRDGHFGFFLRKRRQATASQGAPKLRERAYTVALRLALAGESWRVTRSGLSDVPSGSVLLDCDDLDLSEAIRPMAATTEKRVVVEYALATLGAAPPGWVDCRFRLPNSSSALRRLPFYRLKRELSDPEAQLTSFDRGPPAVLRAATFAEVGYAHLEKLQSTGRDFAEAPAAVLDLRDNGGGAVGTARGWLETTLGRRFPFVPMAEVFSEVSLQGGANQALLTLGDSRVSAAWRAAVSVAAAYCLLRAASEMLARRGAAFRDVLIERDAVAAPRAEPLRHPLVVLVNSQCASACEGLVQVLRGIPGVLLVGENTAGALAFGNPLYYLLPNSRMGFSAPAMATLGAIDTPGFRERRGFLPDLWLDSYEPLNDARRIAMCLTDAECAKPIWEAAARQRQADNSPHGKATD